MLVVFGLIANYYLATWFRPAAPSSQVASESQEDPASVAGMVTPQEFGQTSSAAVTAYQVQAGDTLWSIATNQLGDGYAWAEIAKINDLANPNLLEKGMMLDIPRIAASAAEVSESDAPQQELVLGQQEVEAYVEAELLMSLVEEHQVKPGDSLWKIATSYYDDGYAWVDIWRANQDVLSNPDILPVGVVIDIPR